MSEQRTTGSTTPTLDGAREATVTELPLPTAEQTSTNIGSGTRRDPLSQADVAALIERNYVGLRLLVSRRCRDPQVAADLLNEAVCTSWAKWQAGKIERPEQIAGYVLQVSMNLLRNHRRAIGERPERRADAAKLEELGSEATPSDETIERQIATRVKSVIREMASPRDRAILVRFYLDEEDKEAICRDLGLSSLQFDKILHRARGRLRKLLEAGGFGRSDLLCLGALL